MSVLKQERDSLVNFTSCDEAVTTTSPGAANTTDVSFRVLVVAGNSEEFGSLRELLDAEGYDVQAAPTGSAALQTCAAPIQPDLLLVDFELPDMAGTELCRQIRQATWIGPIPLVLLSSRADDIDRVVAFELGADDYVTRPFDTRELALRVKAILRRCYGGPGASRELRAGKLRMDRDGHRVWLDASSLELTQIEFRLLEVLMMRRGRAQPRDRLLQDVWGRSSEASVRTVDTHIRRLREKLGSCANYVRTVRGVGYSFGDQEEQDEDET